MQVATRVRNAVSALMISGDVTLGTPKPCDSADPRETRILVSGKQDSRKALNPHLGMWAKRKHECLGCQAGACYAKLGILGGRGQQAPG